MCRIKKDNEKVYGWQVNKKNYCARVFIFEWLRITNVKGWQVNEKSDGAFLEIQRGRDEGNSINCVNARERERECACVG